MLFMRPLLVNDDNNQYRRGDEQRDYEMVDRLIEQVLNQRAI